METFEQYCKSYIEDNLSQYIGGQFFAGELGWEITQGPNADGTLTYSTAIAKEYLREWWNDAADYFNYSVSEYGTPPNVFENPERYMVCMVTSGVNILLSQCEFIQNNWNTEFILTEEVVNKIIKELDYCKIKW